jgi:hypothetical protein
MESDVHSAYDTIPVTVELQSPDAMLPVQL